MTAAFLTIAAALVILVVADRVGALAVRFRMIIPGPSLVARTVVVHTRKPDDQTIRGILTARHADRITLAEAAYLHGRNEQALGGIVHVPVDNVAWIQEIEPPLG